LDRLKEGPAGEEPRTFIAPDASDFHLKSANGRWSPAGYVSDPVTSPLIANGYPDGASDQNPERAGKRNESGARGNSGERASRREPLPLAA
jgi:hypothetical protein